jgi:hypothetical protein
MPDLLGVMLTWGYRLPLIAATAGFLATGQHGREAIISSRKEDFSSS